MKPIAKAYDVHVKFLKIERNKTERTQRKVRQLGEGFLIWAFKRARIQFSFTDSSYFMVK